MGAGTYPPPSLVSLAGTTPVSLQTSPSGLATYVTRVLSLGFIASGSVLRGLPRCSIPSMNSYVAV